MGLMTDPQWPESVNLRGVNVALTSTISADAGPGKLFLKHAWQKWDIFCRQDAGVGVDDHSKKIEAVFERNQDVWNSKLAATVEDSLQQAIGPRWCVPRPKAWGGPFAYGCILCYNFINSSEFSNTIQAEGDKLACLRSSKFACFHNTSIPKIDTLFKHQASGLHQAAQRFHFHGQLQIPKSSTQGSIMPWQPPAGSPTVRQWLKFWLGLGSSQSARAFCKELQVERFMTSGADELTQVPLMHNLVHSKIAFCWGETLRNKARQKLQQSQEISMHFDGGGSHGFEVITFTAANSSLEQSAGFIGIADKHMKASSLAELEIDKATRIVRGIGAEIKHFCTQSCQPDNKAFEMKGQFDAGLKTHIEQCWTSTISDRASDAQLASREAKRLGVSPAVELVSSDMAHEVRCFLKNPSRSEPGWAEFRNKLWTGKKAPAKLLTYSPKQRARLAAVQEELIATFGSQPGNSLAKHINDFRFAPQRFDSEAAPDSALVLVWQSFLTLLKEDIKSPNQDKSHKLRAKEALRVCDPEGALYLSMHVELQRRGVSLLNCLQSDWLDAAVLIRTAKTFSKEIRQLILECRIFSNLNTCSFVTLMLVQLKMQRAWLFDGEALVYDWTEDTCPAWARKAIKRIQTVVTLMIKLVEQMVDTESGEGYFEAFDLEAANEDIMAVRRELFNKLCRFRGWFVATSQYDLVFNLAHRLYERGKRTSPEEAVQQKYNFECWVRAFLELMLGHRLSVIQNALIFYGSFQRNTTDCERTIGVLSAHEAGCTQLQRDLVNIIRYGPRSVPEIISKTLSTSGEHVLVPSPLLVEVMKMWVELFGCHFETRRIKRSDATETHAKPHGTRAALMREVDANMSDLLQAPETAIDNDSSLLGVPLTELKTTVEAVEPTFSKRFKEVLAKYTSWRSKRNSEDCNDSKGRYHLTAKEKKMRLARTRARCSLRPEINLRDEIRVFGSPSSMTLRPPFMQQGRIERSNIVVFDTDEEFSCLKTTTAQGNHINSKALHCILLGLRACNCEYVEFAQSQVCDLYQEVWELNKLPLSIKFVALPTRCALKVHVSNAFKGHHKATVDLIQRASLLHGSCWKFVSLSEFTEFKGKNKLATHNMKRAKAKPNSKKKMTASATATPKSKPKQSTTLVEILHLDESRDLSKFHKWVRAHTILDTARCSDGQFKSLSKA